MSPSDEIVKQRIDGVLERSNIPKWVNTTELKDEMFKVVKRLLKAERFATVLIEALNRQFDASEDSARGLDPECPRCAGVGGVRVSGGMDSCPVCKGSGRSLC